MSAIWVAEVEFQPSHILSQETAQAFWERGIDFKRTGAGRYMWQMQVETEEAMAAVGHIQEALEQILNAAGLSQLPDVNRISAARVLKARAL